MSEDLTRASLKDRIHTIAPVIGLGEFHQKDIDSLLQQLSDLNCFDRDPEYVLEFREVIESEIKIGAERIGMFGSRAEGSHQPRKSDLDVVVINPDKKLEKVRLAGKINYWNSKVIGMASIPQPRIHVNRYIRVGEVPKPIIRNAVWVWCKDAPITNQVD